ncbi:hypothetical protein B0J14DRAFT_603034 [Halenospora varia]|nr:hypothetical protein B0J14DRAFT_603034 [Halenospora varia]
MYLSLGLLIPFSFAFSTFLLLLTRFPLFFLLFLVLDESISPFQLLRSFPRLFFPWRLIISLKTPSSSPIRILPAGRVEVSLPRNEQPQVVSM